MRKHKNPVILIALLAIFAILSGSCGKDENNDPEKITDSRDGIVYETVSIGNQVWMAENLRATVYNDGTPIELVTDSSEWADQTNGAYCWYDNNEIEYAEDYGALYNWYAVNTGKLCPTGWHVPTLSEWYSLAEYVGGNSVAGGKLKSMLTSPDAHPRWDSPNTGAVDEFGFSALPGGMRQHEYHFNLVGSLGFWWSSTENSYRDAAPMIMEADREEIEVILCHKKYGMSIRCVKN